MRALRLVFDQHVSGPALRRLRADGIDVVHVSEVGLAEADDPTILAWARAENRIVVTRNYQDFAPLVQAYGKRGVSFPGVLFIASSIRHADVGHHVRTLREWIDAAEARGTNPARGGLDRLK